MTPQKEYTVTTTNMLRTRADVTQTGSTVPSFQLDFSFVAGDIFKPKTHSVVLRSSLGKSDPTVIGTADIVYRSISAPIHLCFGDPDSRPQNAVWEDLHIRDKLKTSGFELNIDLGKDLGRKIFDWKRTHHVEGVGAMTNKIDYFHLKMMERESQKVVARFVHSPKMGSKRGVFEMEEFEGGEGWDGIVLLSGMAVVEYLRKVSGWAF